MRARSLLSRAVVLAVSVAVLAASASFAAAMQDDVPPRAAPGLLAKVEDAPAAPALGLDVLDGQPADLAAGRATVVHFFATWCEPCRTELPALARFAARRPDVAVLMVDVAEPEDRVRRFLARDAFAGLPSPGPVLLDRDRAAARRWSVSLLPASLVVASGRIVLAHEGEVDWDAPATDAALAAVRASLSSSNAVPQARDAATPIKTREDK